MKTHVIGLFALALVYIAGCLPSSAQVLIIVNDTDPTHITLTATTNAPALSVIDSIFNGITLTNFFTGPVPVSTNPGANTAPLSASGLMPIGDDQYYAAFLAYITSDGPRDVNLFTNDFDSDTNAEQFDTGQAAFTGSAAIDLDNFNDVFGNPTALATWAALLPLNGSSGSILVGNPFDVSSTVNIGTWQVINSAAAVPEPSSYALGLLGALALGLYLRRRPARE